MKNRILVGTATVCMALPLMADPVDILPVGPPVAGNSWSQTWDFFGFASADIRWLDIFVVSPGDTFSSPGVRNFAARANNISTPLSDFALYAETPTATFSGGSDFTDLVRFEMHFAGAISNPLSIELFVYNSADNIILTSHQDWNGLSWSAGPTPIARSGQHPVAGNLIPLPTGAAMAFVGLGMIGVRRRRSASLNEV